MKPQATATPARHSIAGALRTWTEAVILVLLTLAGLTLGGLIGWMPLAPLLAVVVPLVGATLMLRAQGSTWRDLGFARAMPRGRFLIYTMATLFGVSIATTVLITPLVKFLGPGPPSSLDNRHRSPPHTPPGSIRPHPHTS